jgi:carbonic anhydrase/acetyltransferase-like protein (isoleucine patch superfamily)
MVKSVAAHGSAYTKASAGQGERPFRQGWNLIFIFGRTLQAHFMSKLRKQLDRFLLKKPKLGKGVYIARGAAVLGDVTIGDNSSVWYNAVLRGDINRIVVGHHSNVQDNAVLHLADDFPCIVGNYVTIGHSAVVHACRVGDEVLVGMGAIILDGAVIGKQSIIGAKALVTQGAKIPPGSLVLGAPAKVVRALTREERAGVKYWATKYVENSGYCLKNAARISMAGPTL